MARIINFSSGPIPSDPNDPPSRLTDGKEVIIVQLFDKRVTDKYEEFILQHPTGELETLRRWFNPQTNKQRSDTALAKKNLPRSLEAAVQTKKVRVHDKRKTRAFGNRLRGEAQRNQW